MEAWLGTVRCWLCSPPFRCGKFHKICIEPRHSDLESSLLARRMPRFVPKWWVLLHSSWMLLMGASTMTSWLPVGWRCLAGSSSRCAYVVVVAATFIPSLYTEAGHLGDIALATTIFSHPSSSLLIIFLYVLKQSTKTLVPARGRHELWVRQDWQPSC